MAKHGKKLTAVKSKLDAANVFEVADAISFLKANKVAKFDETAEIAFRLGVNPTQSDQNVRGTVSLPHGTGKKVRVVVFATGPAAEAARAAGADEVGYEDLLEKVKGGWTDMDVIVATPEAMKEVRKLGKVLGPRGLMPNPKTGTVTDDTGTAVKQFQAGRVEFRMDKNGNLHVPFGKLSFSVEALTDNCKAVIEAVSHSRPPTAKGVFIKRCTISSTMGPGLHVNVKDAVAA
ncbi:MAG TPA: 50S ribosomal protein L1 [Kiritimatiellia bacterium]|nr:50S ribosomal protein L1 [Kiritimatiellia bacterium]HMO98812.1 50S ribosomal protein L1 [Kiritimatiellia bacterium]HMP96240.1 50S ribosomal protein L1 [Kiritimatiellia bacterium]